MRMIRIMILILMMLILTGCYWKANGVVVEKDKDLYSIVIETEERIYVSWYNVELYYIANLHDNVEIELGWSFFAPYTIKDIKRR